MRISSIMLLILTVDLSVVCAPADPPVGSSCSRIFGTGRSASPGGPTPVAKVSRAEIDRRACMMSYGWPEGKEEHGRDVSASEMRRIRDRLRTLWDSEEYKSVPHEEELPVDERVKLLRIRKGWDRTQVDLWGSFMLVKKLADEGLFSEAVDEVNSLKARDGLAVKTATWDVGDENTYFKSQNLRNLISAFGYYCHTKLPLREPKVETAVFALFLDQKATLAQTFSHLEGLEEVLSEAEAGLFQRFSSSVRKLSLNNKQPWQKRSILESIPNLAGLSTNGGFSKAYLQGRVLHCVQIAPDGSLKYLAPDVAANEFRASIGRDLQQYTTKQMKLFSVLSDGENYEIDIKGKTATLTKSEVATLASGGKLPPSHPVTALLLDAGDDPFVLYSNPLMEKAGPYEKAADDVAYALQKAYPNTKIYRDPLSARTSARVARLSNFLVKEPDDLVAVIAEQTFEVRDFKIIQNIREDLESAGVRVVSVGKAATPGPITPKKTRAVIVITGHINLDLAAFVDRLGKAGLLAGNYVMFNTCREPLSRSLAEKINTEYGAIATFTHDDRVDPADLRRTLLTMTDLLKRKEPYSFGQVLTESLKSGHRNGIWTICRGTPMIGGYLNA